MACWEGSNFQTFRSTRSYNPKNNEHNQSLFHKVNKMRETSLRTGELSKKFQQTWQIVGIEIHVASGWVTLKKSYLSPTSLFSRTTCRRNTHQQHAFLFSEIKSLHPRKPKNISSNHWFSGDMLVFWGVCVNWCKLLLPNQTFHLPWFHEKFLGPNSAETCVFPHSIPPNLEAKAGALFISTSWKSMTERPREKKPTNLTPKCSM